MHVDVIDTPEGLSALKGNWDAVYGADPEAHFFLSWTWVANWLRNASSPWLVLAAKPSADAPAYGAFFPLILRTELAQDGGFRNEVRMGGGWFAPYNGLLCDPAIEDRAIPAFADFILGLNWASFKLENISATRKRLSLLLKPFAQPTLVTEKLNRPNDGDDIDRDIYLCVRLPGDWETYLEERLSANTRKKARRALRMLEGSQGFRITRADASTFDRDLGTLLKLWQTQWRARFIAQYGERIMSATLGHYRDMLASCFEAGSLFLPVLWHGDTPIGAMGALIDAKNKSLISLIGGRDMTVTALPPGFVLDLHSIRWAIESGFTAYDLLMGNFSYKYSLAPEERRIEPLRVRTEGGQNLRDKLEPRSLPAAIALAQALSKRGEIVGALAGIRQILDIEPQNARALALLRQLESGHFEAMRTELSKALALQRQGQIAEAEKLYRAILTRDPDHFDATHLLGVALLQQGRPEQAERQIARALEIEPGSPGAHNNRGNALRRLKRPDEALESFNRAIALKPDYAEAFSNRGNALRDLGRNEEALKSYDKAIALKPDYARAVDNRAVVLRELQRGRDEAQAKPAGEARTERAPANQLNVRDYRESDRAACLAVLDTNVPKYFAARERQDFAKFLDNLPGPYLVLEDAGTVVACGGFARYETEPDVVALCWGMVAQDRHKKRLGEALLIERLRRLAETYAGRDVVVYTSQHTAGFFARYGFEMTRIARDHFAPGLDLHKMRIRAEAARRLF